MSVNAENGPSGPANSSQQPGDSLSSTANPHPSTTQSPVTSPLPAPTTAFGSAGPSTTLNPSVVPYLTATRTPPPVAAFAVPLSLVGTILLVAAALSLRHHRHLKDERARDAEKIDLSRRSSFNSCKSVSTGQSDVKYTPDSNVTHGMTPTSVWPIVVQREPRQQTRQAFPTAYSMMAPSENPCKTVPIGTTGPPSRCLTHVRPKSVADVDCDTFGASVTNLVLPSYLLPSPTLPPSLLSAPQQLHVRGEAALSPSSYSNKPLPLSPRPSPIGMSDDGVYDAVACAVGRL